MDARGQKPRHTLGSATDAASLIELLVGKSTGEQPRVSLGLARFGGLSALKRLETFWQEKHPVSKVNTESIESRMSCPKRNSC